MLGPPRRYLEQHRIAERKRKLAAHKERVALGMTTDGGTTTDHCDTEGMTEEVTAETAPLVNGQGYVWAESYGGRPGWVLCIE